MDTEPVARPLISVDELARELAGPRPPLLLDARHNLTGPPGGAEFLEGHIPGAQWVDVDTELSGPPGRQGRHPLPDPAVFQQAMRRVGARHDVPIVASDGGSILGAARLWWLLTDAGLVDVRVLDGGYAAWVAAGLDVATGHPEDPTASSISLGSGRRARVEVDHLGDHDLIDVRTAERYAGDVEPIDAVAGHIPGAHNLPAAGHFDRGRFRSPTALAEHFAQVPDSPVLYCGSGITAAQALLAMEIAGRTDGVICPGSWSAWITDPERPVATGNRP